MKRSVVYRQDIWLDTDPTTFEPPPLGQYVDAASDPINAMRRALGDDLLPHGTVPSVGIEVSNVHYRHTDGFSQETHRRDPPLDREPDAQIELLPPNVPSFGSFELMVVLHLGFQIRDCSLDMGVGRQRCWLSRDQASTSRWSSSNSWRCTTLTSSRAARSVRLADH